VAALGPGGVRLGTAEFYRLGEDLPEVQDSLVVHIEDPAAGPGDLRLFLALSDGVTLDDDVRDRILGGLRTRAAVFFGAVRVQRSWQTWLPFVDGRSREEN
jgi:acyl-coenzyme A synthetase/AMP-(fatty) acid ligase